MFFQQIVAGYLVQLQLAPESQFSPDLPSRLACIAHRSARPSRQLEGSKRTCSRGAPVHKLLPEGSAGNQTYITSNRLGQSATP